MTDKHTPLPWWNESNILHAKYPNSTDTVHPARCVNEADAQLVERAVNNHYKMLEALEAQASHVCGHAPADKCPVLLNSRAAIKAAKGDA